MIIVRVKPTDAAALTAVAHAAKRHWGYPDAWIAEWEPLLLVTPAFIAEHDTFAARADAASAEILGFCALVEDEEGMSLEHLWVLPEAMGRGIGRALFGRAADHARERGFESFRIESDPHAAAFYALLGARRIGTRESFVLGEQRELPLMEYAL